MQDTDKPEPLAVTCLVLMDSCGRIFATQRPAGKELEFLWEFPGGKVEGAETPLEALRREISEELSFEIGEATELPPVRYSYTFGEIRLLPFIQTCNKIPEITLNEHQAARWISMEQWQRLDWAPADIPIIEGLLQAKLSR